MGFVKLSVAFLLVFSSTLLALPVRDPRADTDNCGYNACHETVPGLINVHLIPHSHDDVGWLKTVDQYYYGSKNDIQVAGVQYIIDTVLNELRSDANRRFIYVETAFLWKWWLDHDEDRRQLLVDLINAGQLEMTGGAWSMNDEAATHYQSTIDQFTWGLRKLNDTFGACGRPHIGWQIDPFGHSREMASLFTQFGYDGVFFARSDYQDRQNRYSTNNTEMIWQGSANLGTSSRLYAATFNNSYYPPSGFCFDINCSDEPIIDDELSPDYNADARVADFITYIEEQASHLKTNHILVTMGGDFHYQEAAAWFVNLDRLLQHVNDLQSQGGRLNVLYSTPSCYLKAVNDANETWSVKEDDFFPYASDTHEYWTGYFTSRPTTKYFERQGNNFLQVCKQLYALADVEETYSDSIDSLREAMGIVQHHDAITGTAKYNVFQDYTRLLYQGFQQCGNVVERALNKLSANEGLTFSYSSCLLRNESQCELTETSDNFIVTIYNPLSQTDSPYIRLPVVDGTYSVRNDNGDELTVQAVPIPNEVLTLPGRTSQADIEIIFQAPEVPPLGFSSFYITKVNDASQNIQPEDVLWIGNDNILVTLNASSGLIESVTVNGEAVELQQDFYYYIGFPGRNTSPDQRASGAYIFRPTETSPQKVSETVTTAVYKGALVEEIHQSFSSWVSQVIRVYREVNHIELEWLVGPIPVDDSNGKEIVSRFITELDNNETFYTDSNGREMLERRVNYRPTWDYTVEEPVSGNYYPITSSIVIRDETKGLGIAVLNDRAQGGSSLTNGELEIMLHRRLLYDDGMGVGEALNDQDFGTGQVVRGKHYLIIGNITGNGVRSLAAQQRILAQQKLLAPWVLLAPADDLTFTNWTQSATTQYSGLSQDLPDNVHILTLEPWKNGTLLLRLEHILEQNDDLELSEAVTVDLQALFAPFAVGSIQETTLGANQWLEELSRLTWVDTDGVSSTQQEPQNDIPIISLEPMQIRTFVIEIDR